MRSLLLATLLVAGSAWAQTAPPATQPDMAPPGQAMPTEPGEAVPVQPAVPPAPGEAAPAMPPAPGAVPQGQVRQARPGAETAMSDFPVCTREVRDRCRQPDGRRIPPPTRG
jgi:hypothetical protein